MGKIKENDLGYSRSADLTTHHRYSILPAFGEA